MMAVGAKSQKPYDAKSAFLTMSKKFVTHMWNHARFSNNALTTTIFSYATRHTTLKLVPIGKKYDYRCLQNTNRLSSEGLSSIRRAPLSKRTRICESFMIQSARRMPRHPDLDLEPMRAMRPFWPLYVTRSPKEIISPNWYFMIQYVVAKETKGEILRWD